MKRDQPCPMCGGSGRDAKQLADDGKGGVMPAHCELCAGTGAVGSPPKMVTLQVPADSPLAAEIQKAREAHATKEAKA